MDPDNICNNIGELCLWLSWYALLWHEWTDNSKNSYTIKFILKGYYLGARKGLNIPVAVLLGKDLFRPGEELLDAYILEYLCMGFLSLDTNEREYVVVVMTDKKLEGQLIGFVERVISFKNDPIPADRMFNFVPGYLIIVDSKDPCKKPAIVDVSKLIP